MEMISVNSRTVAFKPMSSLRGRVPGIAASIAFSPTSANASPTIPPASDSRTLSVINCRTMRERLAPNADRTANSRVRAPTAKHQVCDICGRDQHNADGSQ